MSIREEFEKAYKEAWPAWIPTYEHHDGGIYYNFDAVALWAAEWMAKRIEKEIGEYCCTAGDIRQLAKELMGGIKMGIESRIVCDGCGEECFYFMQIEKIKFRSANGRHRSRPMGFGDCEFSNVIFCSANCIQEFFDKKAFRGEHFMQGDFYFPGYQRGIINVMEKPCGK